MNTPTEPIEHMLAAYQDQAGRTVSSRRASGAVADRVRHILDDQPLSEEAIDQLRQTAVERTWYSPRQGWAYAQMAYVASGEWANDLLRAECELALGIALTALGDFAEALLMLRVARQRFTANARSDRVTRCYCVLALLHTEMGRLNQAATALSQARHGLENADIPLLRAYYDRAEGWFYFEKNRYAEATQALARAAETFAALQYDGDLALTRCMLAATLCYSDPQAAQMWIERARQVSLPGDGAVHAARCNYILAWINDGLNQYQASLDLYQQARDAFAKEGMTHWVAVCDLLQGIANYKLNRLDESLHCYTQARAIFDNRQLESHVSRCDLNIALVYYDRNRYDDALALYERVAALALAEGRPLRAGSCYTNMGLCYDRLGRYDQALRLHERAYRVFLNSENLVYSALSQVNLAGTYRRLGQYADALRHCQQARAIRVQQQQPIDVAWCDAYMADLYLAMEDYAAASGCLAQARAVYQHEGIQARVVVCDRELARVLAAVGQADRAHALLASARAVFIEHGLLVDAALCDLAQGEVYLTQGAMAEACPLFQTALATLEPGFPDEAWRAARGLGQCALSRGEKDQALHHWLAAVKLTHQTRAALPTERLSGGFFASRHSLYEETLQLAVALDQVEHALTVAEAGKTQTFLNWTDNRVWRGTVSDNSYLALLLDREEKLKRQMAVLRDKLRLVKDDVDGPPLRGLGEVVDDQSEVMQQLAQLSKAYEETVERLRIEAPGRIAVQSPPLFSVAALRRAARQRLPERWACLAYYLLDDTLMIFYLDPQRLTRYVRRLNRYDLKVLEQCTSSERGVRELIYGDDAARHTHLNRLYTLLIPPEVATLGEDDLLIIAPHAQLHLLPFHALRGADGLLVDRVPTLTVPSLGALETLLRGSDARDDILRVFALGLSDFGAQAKPLPHAQAEFTTLQEIFGPRLEQLWGAQVTRATLSRLQHTGELAGYDVIHFATHTVLDRLAPSQSRVLLHDDSLAFADILNLKLRARLVVLASCSGALGQRYAGDEIMGLAQAFFFAGARTVVASLWPVEDASTHVFMGHFYRHLDTGIGVARALRAAQREMAANHKPYDWAPFVAIGLP